MAIELPIYYNSTTFNRIVSTLLPRLLKKKDVLMLGIEQSL
jgi:hypothetical protein